jgi:hypothetical protein
MATAIARGVLNEPEIALRQVLTGRRTIAYRMAMLPTAFRVSCLLAAAMSVLQPPAPGDLVITDRGYHLRSGADREWAEFPERSEGAELVRAFQAQPNAGEWTLRIRHRDLKGPWRAMLNGSEIARLPYDEADMVTYWAIPPGTLRTGTNELRIGCTGKASDDVVIGPVAVFDRARDAVLSEATVDVAIVEAQSGRPVPGRITVVDANGTLVSFGNVPGPRHAVRPGVVYTATGEARLALPAGRYVIYAGRGFEYGVARHEVDLPRGAHASRRMTIAREVDTAGWVAVDTHLHTGTYAKHGDASIHDRMLTLAGEGIELPVSTEHNTRIDYEAHARDAGVRALFTPIVGSEVTTPALGHFNVFPIPTDAAAIDHRAPDWARLRESIAGAANAPVVVLNHGRDSHGGFRPLGPSRHLGAAGEDLQGWTLPANAMEIVNSGAVMTDPLALPRDWMGLLNRGTRLTPVGSSDSHDVTRYIAGQARTYVRSEDRDPGRIDVSGAIERMRGGEVMVSYGLLAELDVNGRGPGELAAADGKLVVRIRVQGPRWTRAERVALYVNGTRVREEAIGGRTKAGVKWEAAWHLPAPAHDVHLVAVAMGPGVDAPYWRTAKPYQPTSIEFTPYVLGVSGAVFVDADRNGRFESAFEYARRLVSGGEDAPALVARLARYDAAVAVQAASLLRARDPAGFEATARSVIEVAPTAIAEGFSAYLKDWEESRAMRSNR